MSVAAIQTNYIEQRNSPRTAFGGKPVVQIGIANREPLMACVWDVSRTGACLIFAADVHVPAVFTIDFGDMPVKAQVMWRKETFVGVKFTEASSRPSSARIRLTALRGRLL
jgi:hypothetical protein